MSFLRQFVVAVEDNPDDQLLLSRALSRANSSPDLVFLNDGAEAIEYISKPGRLPDLMLIDIKLPKVSGLDLLLKIRGNNFYRNVPVVIMSTSLMRSDIDKAYRNGTNAYIVKSSNALEWNSDINNMIRFWLGINRTTYSESIT